MIRLIILILVSLPFMADCQTDSIWIEGDHICMNKQKAIHFAEMKDSLLYLKSVVAECDNILKDTRASLLYADSTIASTIAERDLYIKKIDVLNQKLGIEEEKQQLLSNRVESLIIVTKEAEKQQRKIKVQRDVLIGVSVGTGVAALISILILAL